MDADELVRLSWDRVWLPLLQATQGMRADIGAQKQFTYQGFPPNAITETQVDRGLRLRLRLGQGQGVGLSQGAGQGVKVRVLWPELQPETRG